MCIRDSLKGPQTIVDLYYGRLVVALCYSIATIHRLNLNLSCLAIGKDSSGHQRSLAVADLFLRAIDIDNIIHRDGTGNQLRSENVAIHHDSLDIVAQFKIGVRNTARQ